MKPPTFRVFRLWYLLIVAIAASLLLRGLTTHPGMLLGWVALVTGGTLLYEVLELPRSSRLAGLILIGLIELTAVIVLNTDNDPAEISLGVVYGIFSTILIGLRVLEKLRSNSWFN